VVFSTKNEIFYNLQRFQKCLRLASDASNPNEAEAAEVAARRLMELHGIDLNKVPDESMYDCTSFANNCLLIKLRQEHVLLKPRLRQKVDLADHERIRLLFNKGLGPTEIGKRLGYSTRTVSSVRHRHLFQYKDWVVDTQGKFKFQRQRCD
jgi:hypothetical protein